ncbi:MAG: hypothetical protein IKZ41_10150, partial [Clostridia bacterium]|nr:hypothetical protein [Clostridia bacterium]
HAENRAYLHILDPEAFAELMLPAVPEKILRAELMNGEEIPFAETDGGLKIDLPERLIAEKRPDTIVRLSLTR